MTFLYYVGLAAALGVGWVSGMWTFKRAERWCAECGTNLTCEKCAPTRVGLQTATKR